MNGGEARVHVLGPVAVQGPDGPVNLSGVLPRGFLAVLALEAPRPVSVDRLAALLWDDDGPAGVKVALQQLASRTRRALSAAGLGDALVSRRPGYALELRPDQVDIHLFRSRVAAARAHVAGGDPAQAIAVLDDACALWSGPPLGDLVDLPLGLVLTAPLEDERWRAEERRAELLIAAGCHGRAVELLTAATAHAPLRERLWVLLATALRADGRSAEALASVRSGAAVIAAMLGVPPGPELAAVEAELVTAAADAPPLAVRPRGRLNADPDSPLGSAMRRALDRAEQAAGAAAERCAFDEAVRHWERARQILDSVDPEDDETRLRILMGLGSAHNLVSLDDEARTVFAEAIDIARRRGDHAGLALAVLGYCAERNGLAPPPEQTGLLEEALAGVPRSDDVLRGRLLGRLALEAYWSDIDRALVLAEEALALAVRSGDVEGRLRARYALAFGCWTPHRTTRLVDEIGVYLDDAVETGDRQHELLARRWMPPPMAEMGDVAGARRSAADAVELADALGNAVQRWMTRQVQATIELLAGDLDRAAAIADDALTHGSVCEPATSFDFHSIWAWTLAWLRGELEAFVPFVEQAANAPGADAARRGALALMYAELGRLDDARQVLVEFDDERLHSIDRDATWFMTLHTVAEAAWHCGDARIGRTIVDLLEPFADRIGVNSVTSTGPVAHAAGVAALAAGDEARGRRLLEQALALGESAGCVVFAARTRRVLEGLGSPAGQPL